MIRQALYGRIRWPTLYKLSSKTTSNMRATTSKTRLSTRWFHDGLDDSKTPFERSNIGHSLSRLSRVTQKILIRQASVDRLAQVQLVKDPLYGSRNETKGPSADFALSVSRVFNPDTNQVLEGKSSEQKILRRQD
jgi:hypothetical protein